jgi:hypothetical protein
MCEWKLKTTISMAMKAGLPPEKYLICGTTLKKALSDIPGIVRSTKKIGKMRTFSRRWPSNSNDTEAV